jgi:hypothetical protein
MSALRRAFDVQAMAPEMCESTVAVGQASRRGQDQLSVLLVAAFGKLPEWVLEVTFFPCGSLTLLLMRQSCYAPEAVLLRAAVRARPAAPQPLRRPFACRVSNVPAGCGADGAGVFVSGAAGFLEASR